MVDQEAYGRLMSVLTDDHPIIFVDHGPLALQLEGRGEKAASFRNLWLKNLGHGNINTRESDNEGDCERLDRFGLWSTTTSSSMPRPLR